MNLGSLNTKEHLKLLRAISEVAIVAYTDKNGLITFANENFCSISGYSLNELLGKSHRLLNSDYHDKEFFVEMWCVINSGQIWRGEIKNKRKDGTFYWVDCQIIPIQNEKGELDGFASIRFDITEKKKLEKAQLELEKLNYILDLAKFVAHEVNNPLTIIELSCVQLNREMNDPVPNLESKRNISKILRQTKRISSIVKRLESFSATEADDKQAA